MNILQSLVLGTLGGLIATFLVFAFTSVFRRIVLPWYRQVVYRGIDISGVWKVKRTPQTRSVSFEIFQKAHSIEGTGTIVTTLDGANEIRSFKLDGTLSDRFLEFRMRHIDPKQLGIVVGIFEVIGDGNSMKGYLSGYKIRVGTIESDAVELERFIQHDTGQ